MRGFLRRFGLGLLGTFTVLFVFLSFAAAFLAVADLFTERSARTTPSYEKADLSGLLGKESWTQEDYDLLYYQTGLRPAALDVLSRPMITEFQTALFHQGTVVHDMASLITPHDRILRYSAPIAPLERGDVLVSSSCHTLGWRNGHAALVVDAAGQRVLESVAPGIDSEIGSASWFASSSNFLLLRLKGVSAEERAKIADWAEEHMLGIPYSLFPGLLSPKDEGENVTVTNCSHLVWQAYRHFGYDIDADGGPVCTPRDIANSPLFEVIQVNGFDPDKLWS